MRTFTARLLGLLTAVLVSAAPAQVTWVAAASTPYVLSTRVIDGTSLTLRWNPCQASVTYRVNAALAWPTYAGRVAAIKEVRAAFSVLGRATGITFRYLGTTTVVPTGTTWSESLGDAEIVVAWVRQGSRSSTLLGRAGAGYAAGTGGFAYKTWTWPVGSAPQAAIGRGFVVLNAAVVTSFTAGFGAGSTRGQLLLHELAHVVGLKHVSSAAQLMYPVLVPRATSAYRPGDVAGLRLVGRPAGCLHVPDWAWPDL